jgi:hypothetical protein
LHKQKYLPALERRMSPLSTNRHRLTNFDPVTAPPAGPRRAAVLLQLSTATALLLGTSTLAYADFIPPAGVTAYRLAFFTADATMVAKSSAIATYNNFVTSEAAQNSSLPSTIWTAIASTADENALTNTSCGTVCNSLPIYLVNGTEVAVSAASLFAGGGSTTINADQFGNPSGGYAWTGTNNNGTASTGHELGSADPMLGATGFGIQNQFAIFTDSAPTDQFSLYAISGEIQTTVPEPASGAALLLGGLVITRVFRRRAQ